MRTSTFILVLIFAVLSLVSFVAAQSEDSSVDSTRPDDAAPISGQEEEVVKQNPYKQTKMSGLAIGENSALAIPIPILFGIFALFISAVGYGVYLIFDSDKQRERKAAEKEAKRVAKEQKKGSKKK